MSSFRYTAEGHDGRRVSGEIEADTAALAIEALMAQRLSPLRVSETRISDIPKLSYQDTARLSLEVSRLMLAGIPLESGALLAAEAQESRAARKTLERAASRLARGDGPGLAFDGLDGAPGGALSAIMAAGERSGRLADALGAAAPLFAATARFRAKIVSLMLYPAVVSVTALSVLVIFLLVVIPSLRPVLEGLGENLPTSARWMLAIADAAPGVLVAALIGALIVIALNQVSAVRSRMALLMDRLALGPMGLGVAAAVDTALFARLFGALLKAGTPAGEAMAEASAAMSNTVLRGLLQSSANDVREGASLDHALMSALGERHLIVQASRLGARGGSFADLVSEAGMTLAERAETRLERLAALAGPMIIILLGLVIGLMVITLFSSLAALPDAATL
ncbi:type II secretion system F family protein [Maricaulis sp.]|uniref:type II secretion system F family protein n=1 Tax=Maricaulis sp. TaxID=1486257 RepID=UPI003A8D56E9